MRRSALRAHVAVTTAQVFRFRPGNRSAGQRGWRRVWLPGRGDKGSGCPRSPCAAVLCRRSDTNWNQGKSRLQAQEIPPVKQAGGSAHDFSQRVHCRQVPVSVAVAVPPPAVTLKILSRLAGAFAERGSVAQAYYRPWITIEVPPGCQPDHQDMTPMAVPV